MNFYDLKSHLAVLALILGVLGIVGCGSKTNAIQTPGAGSGDTTSVTPGSEVIMCKGDSCPDVTFNLGFSGTIEGEAYVGYIGQDVNWMFMAGPQYGDIALDDNPNTPRPAGLFIDESTLPQGASVVKAGSGLLPTTAISWTPTAIASSSSQIVLYARDMAKCKIDHSDDKCNSTTPSSKYDQKFSASWRIVDAAATDQTNGTVGVSNVNCGGNATTDGAIMQSAVTAGIGVMTGGTGSIIGMLPSLFSGIMSSNANQDPVQCLH